MYQRTSTSANRPESWTAGIDWIRWIHPTGATTRPVRDRIAELQTRDVQRASDLKKWSFEGFKGQQSDSIRWGTRGLELLWESSGETAASTLDFMAPASGYASRCDLQITLKFSTSQPSFGTCLSPSWRETRRIHQPRQNPVGLTSATNGLWLGTVGRRTSPRYLRVYDKGVESKLAPMGVLWRIELEAKKTHSRTLCQTHLNSLRDPKFCASYVVSSLTRCGLRWPFSDIGDLPVNERLGKKEETTPGRLAMWLMQSVAPTIPRLLTVFTVAEVLEMLKLSDVAAPIGKDNVRRSSAEDGGN